MSFKTLHQFTVNLDREVTETTTREEGGQTITVTAKVVKPVPHTVILKEPARPEKQALGLFQQVTYNDAIRLGLLPKVTMQQKLALDPDAPMSEGEDAKLREMEARLRELSNDYLRLAAVSERTDEIKAQLAAMEAEHAALTKRIEDRVVPYQSVYAYTAESYTQTKTLSWLTLFLTYVKTGDGKPEPMFTGADFAAKEARAAELEDADDALYKAALEKLPTYWMLYLFGRASKPEDFARIEAEWVKQVEAERKMREEAEKAKGAAEAAPLPTDTPPTLT